MASVVAMFVAATFVSPSWSVMSLGEGIDSQRKSQLTEALVRAIDQQPGRPLGTFKDLSREWERFLEGKDPMHCWDDRECLLRLAIDANVDRLLMLHMVQLKDVVVVGVVVVDRVMNRQLKGFVHNISPNETQRDLDSLGARLTEELLASTDSPMATTPDQAKSAPPAPRPPADLVAKRTPTQPNVPGMTAGPLPPPGEPMANNSRTWGLAVGGGGAALVVGGAIAGGLSLSAYEAAMRAYANNDNESLERNRKAAETAVIAANGLYTAGAVALGVGTVLFLSAPGEVKLRPEAGKGTVSLTIGWSF